MSTATSFYELKAEKPRGEVVDFKDFEGKASRDIAVVLVVNTASKCGFTPQYDGLEKVWQQFKDQPFQMIGFPCNQFGGQEPGTDDEVAEFCKINHGVSFPLMKKSDVNGDKANEVFKYLKAKKAGILGLQMVKWNFEKFLINKKGEVVARYASTTSPASIVADIEKALAAE